MAENKSDAQKEKKSDSQLSFYPAWCKRCHNCIDLCPKVVWTEDNWGYPQVTHPEECTACKLCEKLCPDFAITVGDKTPQQPQARPTTPRVPQGRSPRHRGPIPPTKTRKATMPKGKGQLIQGNEAIVQGALAAGCNFFAGYPITPSSEIMELMSRELPVRGDVFIQMEDEIASMGACIGASLAGRKAMTATSGPGFSLMQENFGYACMAEVPVVVVNVMRMGPSTGMPTNAGSRRRAASPLGNSRGSPRYRALPSTVLESFELTMLAFNHAERFRTPVILLQTRWSLTPAKSGPPRIG